MTQNFLWKTELEASDATFLMSNICKHHANPPTSSPFAFAGDAAGCVLLFCNAHIFPTALFLQVECILIELQMAAEVYHMHLIIALLRPHAAL